MRRIAALLEEAVEYADAVAKTAHQQWPQTDLLVRAPVENVADGSKASLLELTMALNGHRDRRRNASA